MANILCVTLHPLAPRYLLRRFRRVTFSPISKSHVLKKRDFFARPSVLHNIPKQLLKLRSIPTGPFAYFQLQTY
jgi:hypothetical protein